jgi:hypothetical protein
MKQKTEKRSPDGKKLNAATNMKSDYHYVKFPVKFMNRRKEGKASFPPVTTLKINARGKPYIQV